MCVRAASTGCFCRCEALLSPSTKRPCVLVSVRTVWLRAVFDAPCLCSYLFVIYWDGSEFSLVKIIRIYVSLRAVSGRPEASPHTDTHSRTNWVWSLLSRCSIKGLFTGPFITTHINTLWKATLCFLPLFFQHTTTEAFFWCPAAFVLLSLVSIPACIPTLTSTVMSLACLVVFLLSWSSLARLLLSLVVAHA